MDNSSSATRSHDDHRWTVTASVSAVLTAIVASACCIGPLVLAVLGIGGAGLLLKLEPYRPYFIAITIGLLGVGFCVTYRKPKAVASGAECTCERPRIHRFGKAMLWVATALALLALAFPYLAARLFG